MEDNGLNSKRMSHSDDDRLFGSYVDMKAIAIFFWRARWVMFGVLVTSIITGQIYVLFATKKYTTSVAVAERGAQGSSSSLGESGGGGVLAKLLTAKSESSGSALALVYAIKSTAVAERVVKSLELQGEWLRRRIDEKDYDSMSAEDRFLTAVSLIQSQVQTMSDKLNPGLIRVTLTDIDPKESYEMIKHFLIELQYVMSATDLIFNKRLRLFYEDRIKVLDNKLLAFGAEIARLYGTDKLSYDKSTFSYENIPMDNYTSEDFEFGVSSLDFLSKIYENVRSQVKDVQNPDVLKDKIDVPQQVYLTFLEDKYNMLRALRGALTQQYEQSMIEEKKSEQRFVVVEAPVLPKRPSEPNIFFVTVVAFAAGVVLAFWSAIFYYFFAVRKSASVNQDKEWLSASEPALANESNRCL